MNTTTRISKAERIGRWLARGWRGYVRGERWLSSWLVGQGVSASVATILRWTFNLVALGVLLYAAFWSALLLIFAIAAAWVAGRSNEQDEDDFLGRKAEERDHRNSLGYHPFNYDDDPDPRFKDN